MSRKRQQVSEISEHDLELAVFGHATSTPSSSSGSALNQRRKKIQHDFVKEIFEHDNNNKNKNKNSNALEELSDHALFHLDTQGEEEEDEEKEIEEPQQKNKKSQVIKPAWHDDDDDHVVVDISKVPRLRKLRENENENQISGSEFSQRLRNQHVKIMSSNLAQHWEEDVMKKKKNKTKKINQDLDLEEEEEEEELMIQRSTAALTNSKSGYAMNRVNILRLPDANFTAPSKAVVQDVQWRKTGRLMLTAGMDKTLRLFDIDGKNNHKVQSLYLKDLPITTAQFCGKDFNEIILSGRRPFYYTFDIEKGSILRINGIVGRPKEKSLESYQVNPSGNLIAFLCSDGFTCLVDQESKQLIGNVKMNGPVRCVAFHHDDDRRLLYTSGVEGQIYLWDLRMLHGGSQQGRFVSKFADVGSTGTRSLTVSSDGANLASGSDDGVVNLFDIRDSSISPKLVKAIPNLTTAIDHLSFNSANSLLLLLSKRKKDALKLFHMASKQVVKNWPTERTPLSYAQCGEFSPDSSMLAVGNDKGKALLWKCSL